MTRRWWRNLWDSPMASQYLDTDVDALCRLAVVVDDFWYRPKLVAFEAINRAQAAFGLTPLDRRRLEWRIESGDGGEVPADMPATPESYEDPRRILHVV